jgi:nuclear pore complex protein Nup54
MITLYFIIQLMSEEMAELQQQQITTIAKISEYRRKLNDLSHRALKVMVFQEIMRKVNWSVQPIEEKIKIKLEALLKELDSPTLLKVPNLLVTLNQL